MSVIIDRLSAALADRYRIERELGRGGMATVHLAEDLKHKRRVAVKVLKPELLFDGQRGQSMTEANRLTVRCIRLATRGRRVPVACLDRTP